MVSASHQIAVITPHNPAPIAIPFVFLTLLNGCICDLHIGNEANRCTLRLTSALALRMADSNDVPSQHSCKMRTTTLAFATPVQTAKQRQLVFVDGQHRVLWADQPIICSGGQHQRCQMHDVNSCDARRSRETTTSSTLRDAINSARARFGKIGKPSGYKSPGSSGGYGAVDVRGSASPVKPTTS